MYVVVIQIRKPRKITYYETKLSGNPVGALSMHLYKVKRDKYGQTNTTNLN